MESNLLKTLNPIQQQAVITTEGPILVLAGAGSGKTKVLTYKATYLILVKMIEPDNILMLTFTNKAANEMKERISKLLITHNSQPTTNLPFAGTFHWLCAKILRKEGSFIGIPPNYIIYDQQDQKEALKQVITELNLDKKKFNPSLAAALISEAKNELITAQEYPQYAHGYFQQEIAKIFLAYQKVLRENNALDFDDLILMTVNLFQKVDEVARIYQNKFRYVLVDEYQDTNRAQFILTKLLAKLWRNLCVVGDASQSIYGWRGADYRNIFNFNKDYSDVKVFHLEQNYRSTQNILDAAYAVISKNNSHPILKLWTNQTSGEPIVVYQASSEHDEAEYIINQIIEIKYRFPEFQYSDFAVLYRTNAQSRVLEETLILRGIPYILVGGVRFYERKEIKDVLAYLRLLVNPKDKISYKRIEKIGKKRLEKFVVFESRYKEKIESNNLTTLALLDEVILETEYLELYDKDNEEDLSRLENIKELRSVASEFTDLNLFLENVALVEQEHLPDHPLIGKKIKAAVTLMTLHAAKGLEFKIVFLVGMEEGLFPHSRSLLEPLELEEERRLCYVGITRAMKRLYLTFAQRRLFFGLRSSNAVSRFITEIPEDLTQIHQTYKFTTT
ncbi:hypothetical protein A2960_04720 [Candidatus Gottesmanbacteria bacterium RIFCSPLOWO2_01_FULL_39_12b]|uniref:DNA 3'-5' helicase n=1 Tax=Candidatus Gottesmanbacteria bacterium RIFCSPLOWO2_01_FULL_39_12b TaxID=1798388 RepID=A0A1F6AP24_9BACT|nr:MAG: hypothetical protein A2960_04720 [Candidatus Gottesmanbacteria bacterium RIFCSPLOWO2_01_FULL_39_12b]